MLWTALKVPTTAPANMKRAILVIVQGLKEVIFQYLRVDSGQDIRSEMLSVMSDMGVPVENITTRWRHHNTNSE